MNNRGGKKRGKEKVITGRKYKISAMLTEEKGKRVKENISLGSHV
jgi:hypothetical protein